MVWPSAIITVLAATCSGAIAENFPEDDGWGLLWERGMQYNFVPCQGRRCDFVEVWHADGSRASFEPFRNFTAARRLRGRGAGHRRHIDAWSSNPAARHQDSPGMLGGKTERLETRSRRIGAYKRSYQ